VRGGHLQTIVGRYFVKRNVRLPFVPSEVEVDGGDRLSVLESVPADWREGDPTALLVHGLAGCARAPYVSRVGARLFERGVRVVRMNLRGAGTGFGLARGVYHAGRSGDLRRVAEWMSHRTRGSPLGIVGFSLGGSLALKLAAEATDHPLERLDCVIAANPPVDLAESSRQISRKGNRLYDRNFVKHLRANVLRLHARFPELGPARLKGVKSIYEFDDVYTAPRNGFAGADDYYERASTAALIPRIRVAGLVIHAEDDPFIPAEIFRRIAFPPNLALELIVSGGHLGYLSRTSWDGDRRWLDKRIVAWLAGRWASRCRHNGMNPSVMR
jgi:predicted alpha/beta-fold hydrolase